MTLQSTSRLVAENGVCFVVPEPFSGDSGDFIARVGARDYCATMQAYYSAVARLGGVSSAGTLECGGDASVFSGEHICGVARCFVSSGSNVRQGTDRVERSADDSSFVSSGVVGSGRSDANASVQWCSGGVGEPAVADNDDVFGRNGSGFDKHDIASCLGDRGIAPERGSNYFRNRAKRERKKRVAVGQVSTPEVVPEWRNKQKRSMLAHVGVFAGCSEDVQHELRDTRAKMLVAKNKLETEKAAASLRRVESVRKSRTDELEFEMNRLKLEDERRKMIEKRLSELPVGYAETLASAGITSEVPSLSSGSVSPNSSISMAEFHEMQKQVADLKEQIAFDAAEFTEAKVKLMSQLAMEKEKNVGSRKVEVCGTVAYADEENVTFDDGFCGRGSASIRQELKKLRIHEGNGLSSWSF